MHLSKHRFNHSASICHYKDHQVICWYYANRECDDDEKIGVSLIKNGHAVDFLEVDRMAGNGVVFVHNNKLYLLYTRFRKALTSRRVDRWQHCILKIVRLDVAEPKTSHSKIKIVKKPRALSKVTGILPRCNPSHLVEEAVGPAEEGGKSHATIIPLYKETTSRSGYASICFFKDEDDKDSEFLYKIDKFSSKEKRPEYLEHFEDIKGKNNIIQPTVWYEHGVGYQLLARNFSAKAGACAWYSKGAPWFSPPVQLDGVYNYNNSVAVFQDYNSNKAYILWNNDRNGRNNLTLGEIKDQKITKLYNFGKGSYPNGVVSPNGNLHVVFTKPSSRGVAAGTVITYLRITRDELSRYRERAAKTISQAARPKTESN